MATFFYFLGQLFSGQLFELFARETNLKKQSSVSRFGLFLPFLIANQRGLVLSEQTDYNTIPLLVAQK